MPPAAMESRTSLVPAAPARSLDSTRAVALAADSDKRRTRVDCAARRAGKCLRRSTIAALLAKQRQQSGNVRGREGTSVNEVPSPARLRGRNVSTRRTIDPGGKRRQRLFRNRDDSWNRGREAATGLARVEGRDERDVAIEAELDQRGEQWVGRSAEA